MFLNMRQGETETNDDFHKCFKANAETVKLTTGPAYFGSVTLADEDKPDADALHECDEKFRAVCLFLSADPRCYGDHAN